MAAQDGDCEIILGETCPEGSAPGSAECTPVEIRDCSRVDASDPWASLMEWIPVGIAALLFVVTLALLVWLLIEISRHKDDRGKLAAALAEIERMRTAGPAQGQSLGEIDVDLLQRLVALTDFPQAAAASAQLEQVLAAAGIARYTVQSGDPFDDSVHMARVRRETVDPALNRTIAEVIRPGFRTAHRVLRRADVAVWMSS